MDTKHFKFKTGTCLNNVHGCNQSKEWKYSAGIATYYRSKYKSVFSLGANCDAVCPVAFVNWTVYSTISYCSNQNMFDSFLYFAL